MSIFTAGPTALIVSSALDPDAALDAFAARGFNPKLWVAKLTGTDTGGAVEIRHGFERARARGLHVGGWIQCSWSPQRDVESVLPWIPELEVIEFAVEEEYKSNSPIGDWYRADGLVAAVGEAQFGIPVSVISYGHIDTAMRMQKFVQAGWHVRPECYDAFNPISESALGAIANSYYPMFAGTYIHPLVRRFDAWRYRGNRVSIYRPEGLL